MRNRLCLLAAACIFGSAAAAGAADATAGAAVFKTQCSICHSTAAENDMVGPSLFGVVGRAAGQIAGFHYSQANRESGLTWDEATLDRYLASPRTVVPKTTMVYSGLKDDAKRADLIAYLVTLH